MYITQLYEHIYTCQPTFHAVETRLNVLTRLDFIKILPVSHQELQALKRMLSHDVTVTTTLCSTVFNITTVSLCVRLGGSELSKLK